MALTNGPGLGLLVNGTSGEEHYDELMLRWRWLDSIIQAKALDHDLTAPPGSPSDGDTYIVGTAATGAWATHDGKLARYNDLASAWEFLAPKVGWWVWVVSESWYFVFNGSTWVAFDAGGIPDAPSDGELYGRKNAGWEQVPAGLADAPSDGKLYGRKDAGWEQVPAGLADAPSNGNEYVRKDGAWAVASGGASGAWSLTFRPYDNEPPASNFATLDVRNSRPALDFDTTTQEAAVFSGVMPHDYAGGGVTVTLYVAMSTATSGTVGFDVAFERTDSSLDINGDSFATAQTITPVSVPGTAGQVLAISVNVSDGADMDSLAAGELFRLRVRRDVANDDAAGDAELLAVHIREQ